MKVEFISASLFSLILSISIFGQTASDFEKKYSSVKYYEIRPYTLISPTFDKNGEVCRAEIRPFNNTRLKNRNADFLDDPVDINEGTQITYLSADTKRLFPITILNSKVLKELFDELVPPANRKGKGNSSVDFSGFGARYTTKFKFENITAKAVTVPNERAVCNMKLIGDSLDLFFNPPYGVIESVIIIWTDRQCIEN